MSQRSLHLLNPGRIPCEGAENWGITFTVCSNRKEKTSRNRGPFSYTTFLSIFWKESDLLPFCLLLCVGFPAPSVSTEICSCRKYLAAFWHRRTCSRIQSSWWDPAHGFELALGQDMRCWSGQNSMRTGNCCVFSSSRDRYEETGSGIILTPWFV